MKVNNARLISEAKAVDKWVLGRAEAPPNFYVNRISGLAGLAGIKFGCNRQTTKLNSPPNFPATVKPPYKGHIGDGPFVPCREVVLFSEVLL